MPWYLASIVANLCVLVTEYVNHTNPYGTFWATILRTAPFIALMQWALYKTWSGAPTLIVGWAVFTLGNVALRVLSAHFMVGQSVNTLTASGVALIVAGTFVVREGMSR